MQDLTMLSLPEAAKAMGKSHPTIWREANKKGTVLGVPVKWLNARRYVSKELLEKAMQTKSADPEQTEPAQKEVA